MNKKNILVLAGHLDDSILAVGGLIKKLTIAGHHVAVVCFGKNDEAFSKIEDRGKCVNKFHAQAIAAHEILGVDDFVCHGYSDFAVQENKETYRHCIRAIRRVKPDLIFGHYWREYFQHHAMAKLACDSWYQAGWDCSADLGPSWHARALYHFEVIQPLPDPTHLVDISNTFEFKLKAWSEFKSSPDFIDSIAESMEARARFYGSQMGVQYAEALKRSYFMPQRITDAAEEL
jgi:LmbE family N-acetylglucosaminyl deacetylase